MKKKIIIFLVICVAVFGIVKGCAITIEDMEKSAKASAEKEEARQEQLLKKQNEIQNQIRSSKEVKRIVSIIIEDKGIDRAIAIMEALAGSEQVKDEYGVNHSIERAKGVIFGLINKEGTPLRLRQDLLVRYMRGGDYENSFLIFTSSGNVFEQILSAAEKKEIIAFLKK